MHTRKHARRALRGSRGARRRAALGEQVDGRRVVILEEEGARTARDPLHGGGTADAVLLVAAEREWHRGPAAQQHVAPQLLAEVRARLRVRVSVRVRVRVRVRVGVGVGVGARVKVRGLVRVRVRA